MNNIDKAIMYKEGNTLQKRVEELSNQAIDLLHQLSGENEYLEQLLIQLIHRDR